MSAERTRLLAGVFAVLAVLAAIVTAFAVGRTTLPDGGGWSFVLIAGAVAVAFGAVAVTLLRRLDIRGGSRPRGAAGRGTCPAAPPRRPARPV